MHWMDIRHYKRQSGEGRAKFFVRVDQMFMYYGFSMGQPTGENETTKNWSNFVQWMALEENEQTLHNIALTNGLVITIADREGADKYSVAPVKEGWKEGAGKKAQILGSLTDYLDNLSEKSRLNLELAKTVKKEKVLDSGKMIANEVAELFTQLIPLYRAALSASI
jgi:hypothetical protein